MFASRGGFMDPFGSSRSLFGGEPELDNDSNMALTELDKGLRSGNIGEQCEAIVRFPGLFERYPFPILINSAMLKLADVFRCGSNFLRMCVLRVCQQARRHLDKIISVDEFVQRIFSVIHSNDPVARALTLRLLGSIAVIIPEAKEVHHAIRSALDSHDREELEAAILAAARFTKHSKTFSTNISGKISEMMEGLSHPVEIKVKLLPIFSSMHHDAETALSVRALCLDLLKTYPSVEFVVTTIRTLTRLSIATLVNIPEQVSLLLEFLQTDPRDEVKLCALADLRLVAREAPHLWTRDNWRTVVAFASERQSDSQVYAAVLALLVLLAESGSLPGLVRHARTRRMCLAAAASSSVPRVAVEGAAVLTTMVVSGLAARQGQGGGGGGEEETAAVVPGDGKDDDFVEDALLAVQARALCCLTSATGSRHQLGVKRMMALVVKLARADEQICARFVAVLTPLLSVERPAVATALCGMAGSGCREALKPVLARVSAVLLSSSSSSLSLRRRMDPDLLTQLAILLFQSTTSCKEWSGDVARALRDGMAEIDPWLRYRVVRQAARYGHFDWAEELSSTLVDDLTTEPMIYWIQALSRAFQAEDELFYAFSQSGHGSVERANGLCSAIACHHDAVTFLKTINPAAGYEWHEEFLRLRVKTLEAFLAFHVAVSALAACPPPSTWRGRDNNNSGGNGNGGGGKGSTGKDGAEKGEGGDQGDDEDLHRHGSAAHELTSVAGKFRHAAAGYDVLMAQSFDADPPTLLSLSLLSETCALIANAVHFAAHRTSAKLTNGVDGDEDGCSQFRVRTPSELSTTLHLEHKLFHSRLAAVADSLERLAAGASQSGDRTFAPALASAVLRTAAAVLEVPVGFPRFFFQRVQRTAIKLKTTPDASTPASAVMAPGAPHLAVKIEGVVEHGGKRELHRRVAQVVVTLSANSGATVMRQTLTPKNDYFTAHFLLSASCVVGGSGSGSGTSSSSAANNNPLCNIFVETQILDDDGRLWNSCVVPLGKYSGGKNRGPAAGGAGGGGSRASSPQLEKDGAGS